MLKILLTGAYGFVGKKLAAKLHDVASVSVFPKGHDICDAIYFAKLKNIDIVFHLAGKTFVPDSWENPNEFYRVNTMGTQVVLDFCSRTKAKLVYISSYLYEQPQYLPTDEKHPIQPSNPYAHSKFLAEQLCKFYSENFNVNVIILRPFNIYGDEQKGNFLIPSLLKQVNSGIVYVKNQNTRRDFLHVDDFVKACIACIDYNKNNIFNVGSGKSYSIEQVIAIMEQKLHKKLKIINANEVRKNEILDTIADIKNISNELNWIPHITLEEGLAKLIKHENE